MNFNIHSMVNSNIFPIFAVLINLRAGDRRTYLLPAFFMP